MAEYKDGLCARLKSQLRRSKLLKRHLMLPGVSEVVVVTEQEVERRCYHENRAGRDRRPAGWCATCREEAEPGQYGYCGSASSNKTTEQTLNFTTNWGFCLRSAACTRRSNGFVKRQRLQSIYLDILTVEQCGHFTSDINPVRELCAGKKISPLFRLYLAQDESFQELSVEEQEDIRPTILRAVNKTERSWALGGGDTCQGDSGGPLIKVLGKVAVLVGVVSRGTRCGRQDSAGIYIRVKVTNMSGLNNTKTLIT